MDTLGKNIIICIEDIKCPQNGHYTSVEKFMTCIASETPFKQPQVVFPLISHYFNGNYLKEKAHAEDEFIRHLKEAYLFLCQNYSNNDNLYFLGSSHGAYTIQALAKLINEQGLVNSPCVNTISQIIDKFLSGAIQRVPPLKKEMPSIQFMGVFDTIGFHESSFHHFFHQNTSSIQFDITELPSNVLSAYHALAIDETFEKFSPIMWESDNQKREHVEQVWFPGTHGDLIGIYHDSQLADIALSWMIKNAQFAGLAFSATDLKDKDLINPSLFGKVHELNEEVNLVQQSLFSPRHAKRSLLGDGSNKAINVTLHSSVLEKQESNLDYRPINWEPNIPVNKQKDRRFSTRINTNFASGHFECQNQLITCQLIDYAPGHGVKIATNFELRFYDAVNICSSHFEKTKAYCIWQKGDKYGLKFAS